MTEMRCDVVVIGAGTAGLAAERAARKAGAKTLLIDREFSGALTGAVLLGPDMDHVAHLFAWVIERGETAAKLLELPLYHPTSEEGLKTPRREICETVGSDIGYTDDVAPPGA